MIERDGLQLLNLARIGVCALGFLQRREHLLVVDLDSDLLRTSQVVRLGPSDLFFCCCCFCLFQILHNATFELRCLTYCRSLATATYLIFIARLITGGRQVLAAYFDEERHVLGIAGALSSELDHVRGLRVDGGVARRIRLYVAYLRIVALLSF